MLSCVKKSKQQNNSADAKTADRTGCQ